MKKAISIFFVLLANIALLAHSAIPHHHHGNLSTSVVCFHGCIDDDDDLCCELPHHEADMEECTVGDAILADFDFDLLVPQTNNSVPVIFGGLLITYNLTEAASLSDCMARSTRLRAPPVLHRS